MRLRDRADDRQAEAAAARAVRRPRCARSARRASRWLGGHAGAAVGDLEHDGSPSRRTEATTGRAGGVCRKRVLDEVERQPMEVVGATLDDGASPSVGQVERQRMLAAERRRLARPPRARRPPGRRARRLAAPGVGAREQQQVADEPAHPLRRAQRRAGDLGRGARRAVRRPVELLLEQLEVGEDAGQRRAQLVRGVGDELRAGARAWPRSRVRAASSSREHLARASSASSAISSLAAGRGARCSRVARAARPRAPPWSGPEIGRIARRATAKPARKASARPAQHAEGRGRSGRGRSSR